jgi:hypothetical protein
MQVDQDEEFLLNSKIKDLEEAELAVNIDKNLKINYLNEIIRKLFKF